MNKPATQIILGIDPGSRITGYGIIALQGSHLKHLHHGTVQIRSEVTADKLEQIFSELSQVISDYQPHCAAIEQVFMHHNFQAALKLGQARGAAMVAAANRGLAVYEYSAKQVKLATVGYGAANKAQVQHMIKTLMRLDKTPPEDAADALAVALCHANRQHMSKRLAAATINR